MKDYCRQLILLIFSVTVLTCCSAQRPPPTKGTSKLVTKDFLVRGTMERWGYGAYSYVLLPREPLSDERYVALLVAYLGLPADQPANPAGQVTPIEKRNLTYMPVTQKVPLEGDLAVWLNQNYDVSRAAAMLHAQGLVERGPYIVTFVRPLSSESVRVNVAVLDLSSVSKESMRPWLDHFVRASESPNDWTHRNAEHMLLRLNDVLAELGIGVQVTFQAMEQAGKIFHATNLPQ